MYIDCHIHIALSGENTKEYREKVLQGDYLPLRKVLRKYKNKNILFLRDGGDKFGISYIARELAAEEGIIYKTPVYAFSKAGSYGSFLGKSIRGMDEFSYEFKKLLKFKPDHFKLILSGIVDFDTYGRVTEELSFDYDEVYYMIQTAKDKNLSVMVHANSSKAIKMAINAGADTVEHGYYISEEELLLMAEKDVVWVPTLSPLGNLLKNYDKRFEKQMDNIKKIYNKHLENVKKALQFGVKVAVGSDAGAYKVDHVEGFFDELEHLKKTGLAEGEINEIVIKNGKKALNIEVN